MDRFLFRSAFAAILLLVPVCAHANSTTQDFVTGQDWTERMSVREKYMALIPPTMIFSDYDVDLKLSLPQYISLMDQVLHRNPGLENEEVSSLFASTVYLFEPQNRPALRSMELSFLQGDYVSRSTRPRLTIEEVISETSGAED